MHAQLNHQQPNLRLQPQRASRWSDLSLSSLSSLSPLYGLCRRRSRASLHASLRGCCRCIHVDHVHYVHGYLQTDHAHRDLVVGHRERRTRSGLVVQEGEHMGLVVQANAQGGPIGCGRWLVQHSTNAGCFDPTVLSSREA